MENKFKILETSANFVDSPKYTETNENLSKIYQEQTNRIRIRRECDWYKQGEKSLKYFLNLEKSRAVQNQIRNILIGNMEGNNLNDINNDLYLYCKSLLMRDNTDQKMK